MSDLWIYAAVVFVSACAGTFVGTVASTHGPKKRIKAFEKIVTELSDIVVRSLELGQDNAAAIGDIAGIIGDVRMKELVAKYGKGDDEDDAGTSRRIVG